MKMNKIGQPWQNEPFIENHPQLIDHKKARFACLELKISNSQPITGEGCPILSNFFFGVSHQTQKRCISNHSNGKKKK
jgi:hypothetical protein